MEQAYNISGVDGQNRPDYETVLCNQALGSVTAPSQDLRELGPVAIVQWVLEPPRFGYRDETPNIFDVMGANRLYPARRDFSGTSGGSYSAASVNTLGNS